MKVPYMAGSWKDTSTPYSLFFPALCMFPKHPLLPLLDTLTAGEALIVAPWPAASRPADATALSHFESLKGLVRAVRNARAEYGVEEKRKVAATLVAEDEGLRAALTAELQVGCLQTNRRMQRTLPLGRKWRRDRLVGAHLLTISPDCPLVKSIALQTLVQSAHPLTHLLPPPPCSPSPC